MTKEEIKLAQQIVTTSLSNVDREIPYHELSHIYRTTNEDILAYQHHLKNRKNMLSVIASGDQILNSILEDTKNIDGFDISCFPKYYLALKLAAIETLNKEDFLFFFYENVTPDEVYDDMYSTIRKNLNQQDRQFWNSLFDFFDWYDIVNSTLFSSEPFSIFEIINRNKYLQGDNYEKLRDKISTINLKTYTGDIKYLAKNKIITSEYDFINLSSIVYYQTIEDYIELINNLNISEKGEALTYFYKMPNWNYPATDFQELNPTFEIFTNNKSGIMLCSKQKCKIK